MPLDRLVLILVVVIAAAGLTVWLASLFLVTLQMPGLGLAIWIPVALVGYVVVRVIADRLRSDEDDRYDKIDK